MAVRVLQLALCPAVTSYTRLKRCDVRKGKCLCDPQVVKCALGNLLPLINLHHLDGPPPSIIELHSLARSRSSEPLSSRDRLSHREVRSASPYEQPIFSEDLYVMVYAPQRRHAVSLVSLLAMGI